MIASALLLTKYPSRSSQPVGTNFRDAQRPPKSTAKALPQPPALAGEGQRPVAAQQQPTLDDGVCCRPAKLEASSVSPPNDENSTLTTDDSGSPKGNSTSTEIMQATASPPHEQLSPAQRCCPRPDTVINWSAPVYLWTVGSSRLLRLRRPLPYFFRPSQIKKALAEEQFVLARIMINVIKASREFSACPAAINMLTSWEDALDRAKDTVEKAFDHSLDGTTGPLSALLTATPSPSRPGETTAGGTVFGTSCTESPQTPKLTVDLELGHGTIRTPSDDSDTQRLQEEIEVVIRRTPAIQKVTPPDRGELIRKASTAIKDARLSLFGSPAKRVGTTAKSMDPEPLTSLQSGSAYLYALVTPTKRMREMLETDAAVSPVRRSKRILERGQLPNQPLFSTLDEIPDLAQRGFLPNSAISIAQLPHKRDPSSLLPEDSPARPGKLPKPDKQA